MPLPPPPTCPKNRPNSSRPISFNTPTFVNRLNFNTAIYCLPISLLHGRPRRPPRPSNTRASYQIGGDNERHPPIFHHFPAPCRAPAPKRAFQHLSISAFPLFPNRICVQFNPIRHILSHHFVMGSRLHSYLLTRCPFRAATAHQAPHGARLVKEVSATDGRQTERGV